MPEAGKFNISGILLGGWPRVHDDTLLLVVADWPRHDDTLLLLVTDWLVASRSSSELVGFVPTMNSLVEHLKQGKQQIVMIIKICFSNE